MNYTPEERRQIADAFRAAKPRLATTHDERGGKVKLICFAIALTASESSARLAKQVIMERLAPWDNLWDWLIRNNCLQSPGDAAYIQEHRHRWLDALIQEFSE